jgi:hypothetical protein
VINYEKVDEFVCVRCGIRSTQKHEVARDCIDAWRDAYARLELKQQHAAGTGAGTGGWRARRDNRMVVLDGERINLTEAGRRLGISPAALSQRILNRTRLEHCGEVEVDIRAIGADVSKSPGRRAWAPQSPLKEHN